MHKKYFLHTLSARINLFLQEASIGFRTILIFEVLRQETNTLYVIILLIENFHSFLFFLHNHELAPAGTQMDV